MTKAMDVTIRRADAAAWVVVAGEVDLASADRLREALESELGSGRRVLVNLASCTFIDSVGLGVLIHAAQHPGRTLGIVSPSPAVRRLIELTQLDSLIPVFESEADAADLTSQPSTG